MPVAIATGTATYIGKTYFGDQPAFLLPVTLHGLEPSLLSLAAFTLLGAFTGVAAALYVHSVYWMEDRFEGLVKNEYLRHMLGMAMLGTLFYSLLLTLGHYHVEGVGYSTIQAIMDSKLAVGSILLLLFAAKLFATSITLGSGASGGIFSPALFLGATLGGAFGAFYGVWVPSEASAIPSFAMVGMAAMVASSTGAAMTAIVMIFEMTRDYDIVLPMILAVAMAQGVRRYIMVDNIYTLKLTRRGIHIPTTLHSHMFLVKRARNVMNEVVSVYPADMALAEFNAATVAQPQSARHVVITRGERITGLVSVSEAQRLAGKTGSSELTLEDLSDNNFTIAREKDVMFDVIKRMSRRGNKLALVVREHQGIPRAGDLLGYITNDDIAESVAESLAFRPKPKN